MDVAATFRVIGDALSIVSLSLIASTSLNAYKRIPKDVKVPMQWGKDGKPTWRASKTFAMLFAPVMSTLILLVPTLLGTTRNAVGVEPIIIVFAMRSLMAAGAATFNLYYLKQVFKTLEDEGVTLA